MKQADRTLALSLTVSQRKDRDARGNGDNVGALATVEPREEDLQMTYQLCKAYRHRCCGARWEK